MTAIRRVEPLSPLPFPTQPTSVPVRLQGGLPAPPTSFVGREADVAALTAMMLRPDIQLVTLIGPGGVGKSRLAIQVAQLLRDAMEDGVWFVELASVQNPALVPRRIAQTLAIRTSARDPARAVLEFAANRRMLIVLDNFEHLLGARDFIAELMKLSPGMKLLITSRAATSLYGEHRWRVDPLDTAPANTGLTMEAAMRAPAVRLFSERAAAADRDFALTAENAPAILEICRRLDGLPLAIELAAARTATLTPTALLKRLQPRLPALAHGSPDQPVRFQTMSAAIGWSYDLLDPAEQELFRRLSIFVGGFSVEAAESAVADLHSSGSFPSPLDQLGALVDQSLVQREDDGDDARFSMFEVVREFGLKALELRGELESAKRRHAAYYLEFGTTMAQGLSGSAMASSLATIETDLPNIRSALSWAIDRGEIETALRLAAELYPFWNYRGHLSEGRSWLAAALNHAGSQPRTRIDGLLAGSGLAALQGEYEAALELSREAGGLARQHAYRFGVARARLLEGIATEWQGDFRQAAAIYGECSAHVDALREPHWRSRLLAMQSEIDVLLGDTATAEQRARMALTAANREHHAWNAGIATGVLAFLALERGHIEDATPHYWENLNRYRELGDLRGLGGAIAGFAGIVMRLGRKQLAARLLGAARATGDEIGVAHLGNKGLVERIDALVRAGMQPAAFHTGWDAGYALGREWAATQAELITCEVLQQRDTRLADPLAETGLTRREREVLYLLARRLTDKEIADALSISPRTAMNHVANVIAKLGLGNRRDVARWAGERGLAT